MGIFDKFKLGLSKSSKSLSSGLNDLIFKRKIDENMLDELEDFLIQSDVGVESAKELREKFANIKINPKSSEKDKIFKIFSNYAAEILKPLEKNLENLNENKPSVILIAGVNGVGKTTTIGKLGKILGQNNKRIVFGAADTFRAAAVSQLEVWAKRINADIIKSEEGADPASVAYKALEYAKNIFGRFGGDVVESFSLPSFKDNFQDGKLTNEVFDMGIEDVLTTFAHQIDS